MLYSMGNLNSLRTRVDNPHMDYRSILANKRMNQRHYVRDRLHSGHTDSDCTVCVLRLRRVRVVDCIAQMDRLYSQLRNYIVLHG